MLRTLVAAIFLTGATPSEPSSEPAKDYTLNVVTPVQAAVGAPTEIVLTITPKAPWALHTETPFSANLSATTGLSLAKARLDAKDFLDPKADSKSVKAAVTATVAGEHTLSAELSFFLCTDTVCKRLKETASAKLIAK
jgi:hypothetical protein